MNYLSLSEARIKGETRYYTGKPCKYGHTTFRYVIDRSCGECIRLKARKQYAKNPQKAIEYSRKYYEANKTLCREKAKIQSQKWRELNPNKESIKEAKYKYKKSAKGRANNSKHLMARRTGIKQSTPLWGDIQAIGDVYMEAAYMQMQVDHIVPLRNPLVCGLHVWDNLQIMNSLKNNQKGNRFWPEMPA